MSSKPIFAEKEDCKKNWHEIPADFSVKVFLQPKFRQKQKQHLSKIINETPKKLIWEDLHLYKNTSFAGKILAAQKVGCENNDI